MNVSYIEREKLRVMGLATFRRRGMSEWARGILKEVSNRTNILITEMASNERCLPVSHARNEAMYLIKSVKPELSSTQIGKWFNRDHSTVLHGIAAHQERTGARPVVAYKTNRDRKRRAALASWYRKNGKEAA